MTMIKVSTPLRKKFALLDVELQRVLLADLGFLTLETEADQLAFVEEVLSISRDRQKIFLGLMLKKQASPEYYANVASFNDEFNGKIVPKMKKVMAEEMRKIEEKEKLVLEDSMDRIINDV